jgi:thiol-disulfide isomerase/thioredoxin
MEGVVILLVVLGAATAFGLWRQRTDGRMSPVGDDSEPLVIDGRPAEVADHSVVPVANALTGADLGSELGERATLVQFSSAFCQPCRATRVVLADVAAMVPGVTHVEIDAESHLDLVRRLDVLRTPTVFVLDAEGRIRTRATGAPRKVDVIAALGEFA